MKITLFIGGLAGGGAERVTCNLASWLVDRSHDVEILTMSDVEATYPLNVKVRRKSLINKCERHSFVYNAILRAARLCKYLRYSKRDVIIVMLPETTILLLQLSWMVKAKIIAAERNNPSSYTPQKQKNLSRLAYRADAWAFQTEEEKLWYQGKTGRAREIVIPNAINPDFIRPAYTGERKKVIVSAGRMSAQKNQELLVRAFAAISKDFPDYHLVIYGEGEKRNTLTTVAEELGVKNKVEMPGYITSFGEMIKDASLFVLPSDFEGMPNALMEAMALGLPCISTDCDGGGARFLIENEKNGILVPKGDVAALANAMRRMLSDCELAESCGLNAHKICERLAPEKVYGQWEEFIKEVSEIN